MLKSSIKLSFIHIMGYYKINIFIDDDDFIMILMLIRQKKSTQLLNVDKDNVIVARYCQQQIL